MYYAPTISQSKKKTKNTYFCFCVDCFWMKLVNSGCPEGEDLGDLRTGV